MGVIGFGGYRISIKSAEHRQALTLALSMGCSLVDTSSNYTNGESEELIGSVLKENPSFNPTIVTKAGYVQGQNLEILNELNSQGLALDEIVDLGENLKHSIHPDFLKNQIDNSLKRLQRSSIDIFLLHNPEYYFKTENATQEEYYRRIMKAFIHLESEVANGRIKSYGISSNNFILPLNNPEVTDLSKLIEIANKISDRHHFSTIQFPFNLIEIGALEKFGDYGDESLLELAKRYNLITMINRPLNAFTNDQLVRLATYDFMTNDFMPEVAHKDFEICMKIVEKKWIESTELDEQASGEDFNEISLVSQFRELWNTLPTPDAVDQVYFGHIFPFIARIWGDGGLSAEESAPFYKLLEHSYKFSRLNMSKKAQEFQKQASAVGLIPMESDRPFSVDVVETYLNYGFDFVLLGMRKGEYVSQVKHLFHS